MQAARTSSVMTRKLRSGRVKSGETGAKDTSKRVYRKVKEAGASSAKTVRTDVSQIRSYKAIITRVILFVTLILLLGIAIEAYSSAINYEIYNKKTEISEIKNEIDTLSYKIASANSPNVIEAKAKELGMEYPSVSQYVYIDSVSDSSGSK